MRWQHLDVVGQCQEAVAQAREELVSALEAGVDAAGRLVEQVRSADVADEHEVAGEHEARLLGLRAVGHEERQVFGRVAGGVHRSQRHVADDDLVAVVHPVGVVEAGAVGPVGSALVGDVHAGTGARRELAGA